MKPMIQCLFILVMLLVVSSPVYSASEFEVVQIWACEMADGTTEAEVEAITAEYLKAVRSMEGGAGATMRVFFPAVVNNTGQTDVYVVLNTPSFTDWGKIWDGYQEGSALAAADDKNGGKVVCPDSMLWEAHVIEPAQ
jgi:hypothetical protein